MDKREIAKSLIREALHEEMEKTMNLDPIKKIASVKAGEYVGKYKDFIKKKKVDSTLKKEHKYLQGLSDRNKKTY